MSKKKYIEFFFYKQFLYIGCIFITFFGCMLCISAEVTFCAWFQYIRAPSIAWSFGFQAYSWIITSNLIKK